jgi:predicted secreted protein
MKKITSLFLVFILGACSNAVLLDDKSNNNVKVGQDLEVHLPESHKNGYNWLLKDDFDQSIIEHRNSVWHGEEKGIVFHLRALKAGKTTLSLIQRKYRDTTDSKQIIVEITDK